MLPDSGFESPGENSLPTLGDHADKNWFRSPITAEKWDRSFPYQLRILKLEGDVYKTAVDQSIGNSVFTLPIPPESIEVSTPFAIATTITMGGSVEEHNGAPIRMITLSGSLGVAFGRSAGKGLETTPFAEAIFAGTLSAAKGVAASTAQLFNQNKVTFNVHPKSDFKDPFKQGKLTGYYQARLLQGFLESYAELKKSSHKDARLFRLGLCLWKDEQIYLVQPMNLQLRKAANSPLEYLFSLQLKATKRINLNEGVGAINRRPDFVQRNPNKMAALLNTIEEARQVLQGVQNMIRAVGADIAATLFETLRKLSMMAKDAMGIPMAAADVSLRVLKEARQAIAEMIATIRQAKNLKKDVKAAFDQVAAEARGLADDWKALGAEFSDDPHADGLGGGASGGAPPSNEILRRSQHQTVDDSVYNTPQPIIDRSSHPALSVFEDPVANHDFFAGIMLGDLNLSPHVVSAIAEERDRIANTTRLEFEEMRDNLADSIAVFSQALGVSHPTFEKTYGLDPQTQLSVDQASDEDFEALFALNRVLTELNRLTVADVKTPHHIADTMSSTAGMAERSGIAFRIPRSKFAVPFPYGSTLEMVGQRYLADPNRWLEIAALNGLKAPYVDEEGFYLSLVVNGQGSNVIVADVLKLFVGQSVWITSTAALRTRRSIRGIEPLAPGQWLVSLDGAPDMHLYATLAKATLFAFTPHTVNSQQLIFIPSNIEPKGGDDFRTLEIPGLHSQDPLIAVAGADLLLTPTGDLVLTPTGETRWAVGMVNLVQRVRLSLGTRKGTLNQHPTYGLPLEVGMSVADVDPVDVVKSIETMFADDRAFAGIKAAQVRIDGPVARISVGLEVSGINQLLPISVEAKI